MSGYFIGVIALLLMAYGLYVYASIRIGKGQP